MRRRSPFDVLDVSPLASFDEARAAYRRLAAIFHPDRFADARDEVRREAEKQMRYVNAAWDELQVRLRSTDQADRAERERLAEQWAAPNGGTADRAGGGTRTGWDAPDEADRFASRARHARTRQRTWPKSSAAGEQRAQARQRADEVERDEVERAAFIRQAQARLAEEEDRRAGARPDGAR